MLKMEVDSINFTNIYENTDRTSRGKEEDSTVYEVVRHKEAVTISSGEAAPRSHFTGSPLCLGILCVFLVTSISVNIYIGVLMDKQKANLKDFEIEIQRLTTEKGIIQKEKEQLITEKSILQKETEQLSRLAYTKCNPCQKGWILFQEKCYLFYNETSPWKTWQESREYCQNATADLVVVNSPQEQEFISENIEYYYDEYHGYWLGLQESEKTWLWVDGSNDTLKYWMTIGSSGPCGLMIPERNLTASWDPAECQFLNKFICESEVVIRSD